MQQAIDDIAVIPAEKKTAARTTNLLRIPFIRAILRSRWYPGILQWLTLGVFVMIVYQLLLGPTAAHDNFGTALTWVLWWPLIPIIFLFLGRFWCAICPFATISDLVQKVAGNNRPVPKFLKKYGIWIIDALFILVTWSDHVFGIVESPLGSGTLLLGLTTGAIVSGAFFQRRTWCRHLCFLGGMSGNYARTGMLAVRGTPEICAKCTIAACYKGTEKAPGCPLFEFPKTMESNANCNVCGYCIKNCPNDSPRLTVRVPTKELWSIRKPRLEEAFLSMVIMGIVFVQNFTMLEIWKPILGGLENALGTTSYAVTFSITFLIAMAIPIGLMSLTALVAGKINGKSLVENFAQFGYAIIPLDIAAHIGHNLFHLLAEGKAVAFTGLTFFTGQEMHGVSTALVGTSAIQALQYGLIALGTLASVYAVYKIAHRNYETRTWRTVMPYAALTVLLAIFNIVLFALPMAMRM